MGQDVNAYIAYGVILPEFISEPWEMLRAAEDALKKKHGNPKYHHQCEDRPPRGEFDGFAEWQEHVNLMKERWYVESEEGARRKAYEDEWSAIGIGHVFNGSDGYAESALVDEPSMIVGGWEEVTEIDGWPDTPDDFMERLDRLFDLVGVEVKIKSEPRWMLIANLW